MRLLVSKQALIIVSLLIVLGFGIFVAVSVYEVAPAVKTKSVATPVTSPLHSVIGKSAGGRAIDAYVYGGGPTHLLFVGGIHGGYEWNSVLLAYQFMDYLKVNPDFIPKNISIAVIPSANPDGVFRVTGKEGRFAYSDVSTIERILESGRFNSRDVDINRNFDCNWKPKGIWKSKTVSAGTKVFSEGEAIAIRDFVKEFTPDGAIFWHSKASAVYASQCKNGILPKTLEMLNTYARASGYNAIKSFDAYEVSGASEDWLASIDIPAITVELSTHETVEWERNLAGINAVLALWDNRAN